MTTAAKHLVVVWDPSRGADVLGAHVALLLDAHRRAGAGDRDDVYVWWGKIRSSNRQQPLKNLADVLALDASLGDGEALGREMHLYLTDYRSLYVAQVAEVESRDVRLDDAAHVPGAVYPADVNCDCWFMLLDVKRLVLDDTVGVIAELRKLSNTGYNGRPVSLYGGMVDLPLIVTRDDGTRYFDPAERARSTDRLLWAEADAEHAGLGATERDLRENLFGAEAWSGLEPAARSFVATAERVLRDNRDDPAFDFSPAVVALAKAFEVQANWLLRAALGRVAVMRRTVNVDGRSKDLATDGPFELGKLAHFIAQEQHVNEALGARVHVDYRRWVTGSLAPVLGELARWRNPAAHTGHVGREEAVALRDRMVGVGCEGELVKLGKVRVL